MFQEAEHSQTFPSDWFALFVNAWGVMELWKGRWCFFCDFSWLFSSTASQFEHHYPWYEGTHSGVSFSHCSTCLRWPLFCCVFNFQIGRDFGFCSLVFFLLRACQTLWERSGPLCVWGLGLVLDVVFVFGVVWVELWSAAPTAGWWWAAPRCPSCCATWWSVSLGLKTSLPDARLRYRLTVALEQNSAAVSHTRAVFCLCS